MPVSPWPIENVAYRLKPAGGVPNEWMLSCTEGGGTVDLYEKIDVDNPGRQHWLFKKMRDGVYEIHVSGNVSTTNRLLSCTEDGETVDLYWNDQSGRQMWKLIPDIRGWFVIEASGGVGERKYLSCSKKGAVDLWGKEDGSGRQQWNLVPEDIDITKITLNGRSQSVLAQPDYLDRITLTNRTGLDQQMTAHFSRKVTETSSFEHETSVGISISATTKVSIPEVGSESLTVTVSAGQKWSYGKIESQEDTRSYDFPIVVKAGTKVDAEVRVAIKKLDIPYIAEGTSPKTGQKVQLPGIWHGLVAGDINTSYVETKL
jgi:hypothetical protein